MIDYEIIADSLKFYSSIGYKRIEVPWVVSKPISDITRPSSVHGHDVIKNDKLKTFVGSGEQGFLYLMAKSQLPHGFYVTTTPCMRDDTFDETHTKYFVKTELIHVGEFKTDIDRDSAVEKLMRDALQFFRRHTSGKIQAVSSADSIDWEYNGIEIGSYGMRRSMVGDWIFGTGVAEPRFSRLLKYYDRK